MLVADTSTGEKVSISSLAGRIQPLVMAKSDIEKGTQSILLACFGNPAVWREHNKCLGKNNLESKFVVCKSLEELV